MLFTIPAAALNSELVTLGSFLYWILCFPLSLSTFLGLPSAFFNCWYKTFWTDLGILVPSPPLLTFLLPFLDVTSLTGALPSGIKFCILIPCLLIAICKFLASPFLKLSALLNILLAGTSYILAKASGAKDWDVEYLKAFNWSIDSLDNFSWVSFIKLSVAWPSGRIELGSISFLSSFTVVSTGPESSATCWACGLSKLCVTPFSEDSTPNLVAKEFNLCIPVLAM